MVSYNCCVTWLILKCSTLARIISNHWTVHCLRFKVFLDKKKDQNPLHSVSVRNLCWKYNFRANFGGFSLGFDVKAQIPQGLSGSPNYFGLLNNLMTLIICESLREIGEMACVMPA